MTEEAGFVKTVWVWRDSQRDKAEPSTSLCEFRQVEQEEEEHVLVGPVTSHHSLQQAPCSPPPPEPVLGTCPSTGCGI